MFKPTAKEALEMHGNVTLKVLKDIAAEIENTRMDNRFRVSFDLTFDRKTDAGRSNFNYICFLLTDAGYIIESEPLVSCITIHIPIPSMPKIPCMDISETLPIQPMVPFDEWPATPDRYKGPYSKSDQRSAAQSEGPQSRYRSDRLFTNISKHTPTDTLDGIMQIPEALLFVVNSMPDGTKKELVKCCANQIIEDKTHTLFHRFGNIQYNPAITIPEEVTLYRIFETVLPGMGMLLLNSDFLFRQSPK